MLESSCFRKTWSFFSYYASDEKTRASSDVAGPGQSCDKTRLNGVVIKDR